MKDTLRLAIIMSALMLLLLGAFYFLRRSSRIPQNELTRIGNTAGNLYNEGLFCEDEGKVYFSNPYDSGALYVMNPDESDIEKLAKYDTKYINAAGDYLYFYQAADGASSIAGFGGHMMGVYRARKNGENIRCLDKTPSGTVALCGNKLYYEHYTNRNKEGMTLYEVSTDKKIYGQVVKEIVDPSCVLNGGIYYAGTNGDHSLYYLDSQTNIPVEIYKGSIWNPTVMPDGNTVYYMRVDDDYSLHKLTLSSGEDVKITDCRVDCYNVTDYYIYYQKNDKESPALMRCDYDGNNSELVAEGNYTQLNATTQYLYFKMFGADNMMYHTPVSGPVAVSAFSRAMEAVK